MALIKTETYINQVIQASKVYFQNILSEEINDIDIYVSNNINEDVGLFSDEYEEDDLSASNPNGTYIKPNKLSQNSVILISYELFYKSGYPFIATILHELTHAVDYNKFNKEYCNGNWDELRKHPVYKIMYCWSEYHARIIEITNMRILISLLFPDQYTYDIEEIKKEMIKLQLPRYNQELIDVMNKGKLSLSEIFKYCARIYSCKLFNKELSINDNIPKSLYDYFPSIKSLYNDLEPLQTYETASAEFNHMKFMLNNFL